MKVQLFKLSTTCVKVHQIPHIVFQTKVSFSLKLGSFFSVMRDNSSLAENLYAIDKSSTSKVALATVRIKTNQIPYVIFGTISQFFFKLCTTLPCHET